MAYSKESQARYKKKITQYSVKYSLQEQKESKRVKAYLDQSGQSANAYIKGLIKADLDSKRFMMDSVPDDTDDTSVGLSSTPDTSSTDDMA